MSIIVYKQDALYSDSRGEVLSKNEPEPAYFQTIKIHISPCKRLALGIVGHSLTPEALAILMNSCLVSAQEYVLTGSFPDTMEETEMFISDEISIIGMTSDVIFHREGRSLRPCEHLDFMSYGSVGMTVRALIQSGMHPKDAIEWTCAHRYTVGLPVQTVTRDSLLPLMNKEVADVCIQEQ